MTDLVLVRHAQSVWNAEGRWQGWADPPLTALGERQAAAAGRALVQRIRPLDPPAVIAASDLRRARQTAELLAAGRLDPARPDRRTPTAGVDILVDADLREYDTGDWTGLRRVEIAERWPEELADWDAGRVDAAPGGEDRGAFVKRLFAAIERLRRAVPTGPVLAVSHGRAIRAVSDALGGPGGHVGHLTGWHLHLGTVPTLVDEVSLLHSG